MGQFPDRKLQGRVWHWMMECFGAKISSDKTERVDRFIEEALELAQSVDYPRERVEALIDYTYGRPKGEPDQEVGGVMITLAALCLAHDLDMHDCGEVELVRIWTKIDAIRAKQAAKPTGSALPIAVSPGATRIAQLEAALTCALNVWAPLEPGDSRAVSDEFVAVASVLSRHDNEQCHAIIAAANARST